MIDKIHNQRSSGAQQLMPDIYYRPENIRFSHVFRPLYLQRKATEQRLLQNPEDVFRETPVRYLGFTNEVTTATHTVRTIARAVPFWNKLGWGVSLGYGFLDAFNKGKLAQENAQNEGASMEHAARHKKAAIFETLLFHTMASWVLPVAFIMGTHKAAEKLVHKANMAKGTKAIPVLAGLAVIPLITKVLDPLAEKFLHQYVEPILERQIKKSA